ncbi:MAG: M48 family metallopeptidase [Proteobacteria bacterium]|nr:M48 family metallopeptidase [Pseudomonadota bacterium]
MNTLSILILIFLVSDFTLHFVADVLNLKVLSPSVPESFSGIYEETEYVKAQSYLKTNTKFGWIISSSDFVAILLFWFCQGFANLDAWVRSFNQGPVITGMLYMGILVALKAALSLPTKIYDTFVIEEKFGFNKTNSKTFAADLIKILFLSLLIGGPLLAGILFFFEYAGENAWWICWITVSAFVFILQYAAPNWIMPLFNTYTPLEDGSLKTAIMAYAKSIHFPLNSIQVMDGSKRSGKSNAFFAGFGKNKRIVLFDTLMENHDDEELLAVLAHEMGHYKLNHIQKMLALGILQMGVMLYILSWFISYPALFEAFFMKNQSVYAGIIFFGLLYSPIDFFVGIFFQFLSRRHEYQADRFAVTTTGSGVALEKALKKLSVHNLSNLTPHRLFVFLNYSHPPVLERIIAIGRVKS